jgi:hypothetical protein
VCIWSGDKFRPHFCDREWGFVLRSFQNILWETFMGIDEVRLRQIYENWKTEDLIKAVTIDKANYEPLAIDLMSREIQKRKVRKDEITKFKENILERKERLLATGTLFCPNCLSTNVKEVFGIERLIKFCLFGLFGRAFNTMYECRECGYHFSGKERNWDKSIIYVSISHGGFEDNRRGISWLETFFL